MSEIEWAPYIERLEGLLKPLKLKELDELEGEDIKPARNIKTPMGYGWFKAYKADKIKKIALGDFYFMRRVRYGGCMIWPEDDYELPLYASDWDEPLTGKIHTLVDLFPSVDPLVHEDYRIKYSDVVEPLWNKYSTLPGLTPESEASWGRGMCSHVYTCAMVPTEPGDMNSKLLALEPHLEYLKVWINLWKKAEPIKDEKRRKEVIRRRAAFSKNYRKYFTPIIINIIGAAMGEANAKLMMIMMF